MSLSINRNLSFSTKCNVIFGGSANQIGWGTLGFGMIFFWFLAMNADLSFLHYTGKIVTVKGVATDSVETSAEVNERSVYENYYKFTTKEGELFEEYSYATGRGVRVGQTVVVEYPEGKPEYSRIRGMGREMFGPLALLVLLVPLIGLTFLYFGIKRGLLAIKLLKYGVLTKGKLFSKVATNVRVNEQTVYKLTFRFNDELGKEFEVSEKTHLTHLLEDEAEERLMYLKSHPSDAIMLDSLPSSPSVDENENVKSSLSLKVLFIPLVTVLGHGYYVITKYLV